MLRLAAPFLLLAPVGVALLAWSDTSMVRPTDDDPPGQRVDLVSALRTDGVVDRLSEGDLVFRTGRSWLSRSVLEADPRAEFSHVGLLVRATEADDVSIPWVVIHVEPEGASGEEVSGEHASTVHRTPLTAFLARHRARAAAIYRVSAAPGTHQRAAEEASRWARHHVPFDAAFDSHDGSALYCTELVWRAYRAAGIDLLDGRLERIHLPLATDDYVLPSSLTRSRHVDLVWRPGDHEPPSELADESTGGPRSAEEPS